MLFNSAHFLIFFPIVLAIAWQFRRSRALRLGFLLGASYYFYMSWNIAYAGLILGSTVLDFFVAQRIAASQQHSSRRRWLIVSLAGNLGVLFTFKYYNFFLESFRESFGALGLGLGSGFDLSQHSLLLPVGISFYTFQTLSYTIDVYRGTLAPTRSFLKFSLFVSFFPQLVAGPIVRASHFMPQLDRDLRYDDARAERGLVQMLGGLFKKVCIADVLGVAIVDPAFADPSACGSAALVVAMYAYAFQIYYDFCGYSDVAIGAARMLGFDLPINFDRPYLATSVRNFWRRWHISLSTWLRDYLFVPLGGGRCSASKTARNLMIVMLLGGLWHGAAWGFVLWGALHGVLLVAGRVFNDATGIDPDREDQPRIARLARIIITFHLVAFCLVIFRAPSATTLTLYVGQMFAFAPGGLSVSELGYLALLLGAAIEWCPREWVARLMDGYGRLPSPVQAGVICGSLLLFAAIGGSNTPFIYFQF